jgi:GNAT superfamily N-acetyltransferase
MTESHTAQDRPAATGFAIRAARPEEYPALGQLLVRVYGQLDGFPKPHEQPKYYEMLENIGNLALKPDTQLLVAAAGDRILGGLVYFSDMAQYGSGGTATREKNASGFRLLGVAPEARGMGVAKALVEQCIAMARERGHAQVVIHTTGAMQVAWKLYEARGFKRSEDLDFMQGDLQVYGFRLRL